jgi:hypothetical protein
MKSKNQKNENSACACACNCAREIKETVGNSNPEIISQKIELMNMVEKLKTEIEDYKKVKI